MDFDNPSYYTVEKDEPDKIQRKNSVKLEHPDQNFLSQQQNSNEIVIVNNNRRNFHRSVSSNSADSNQELLIMGEPRINDVAPDLVAGKCHNPVRPSNSLKRSVTENKHLNRIPLVSPTSNENLNELPQRNYNKKIRETRKTNGCEEEEDEEEEEEEVFVNRDSAVYSNLSANKRQFVHDKLRRHSCGTFTKTFNGPTGATTTPGRGRTNSMASTSTSFRDDLNQIIKGSEVTAASVIDEHSLRHMSYPRKRCVKCSKGTLSKQHVNMDDILIVALKSSDPANLWVTYFTSYFEQISKSSYRKPFKIQNVYLEDILNVNISDIKFADGATGVKLQLVVVCPAFLEFAIEHPAEISAFSKLLLPDRTLALLLGVTDDDLIDVHKNALPSYFQWQRQSVGQDQDQTFAKEFLSQAMTIFSKVLKQQSALIAQEKACFSVQPKKIRQGQTSVFIILTHPLQKEDAVKISIERSGELHEIKSIKRRNPYTIKITVPENFTDSSAIVNVLVEKNGSIIGSRPIKCESKLREMEQILRSIDNPISFMCKSLGFNPANRQNLDNYLVQNFQKKLPLNFNLLGNQHASFALPSFQNNKQSNEEFPTLLHFAAKYGLEKLAIQLLDCPGADIAYDVRNVYDMTPPEVADANGHQELSNILRGYMKMNEVSTVYAKLKEISFQEDKMENDEENYLKQKDIFEQFYKVCPPPRPVNAELHFQHHTPNAVDPITPLSDCDSSMYLAMDRAAKFPSKEDLLDTASSTSPSHGTAINQSFPGASSIQSPFAKVKVNVIEDKVQKELAEIIMDFKNNVHSLAQVEKLVEDWKNRNDVQKSFEEKQQQLHEMRMRYEKIQHEIKATTKKPSSFERVRRLFSRNQKPPIITAPPSDGQILEDSIITTPSIITSGPAIVPNQSSRPISSLSTSSSGSSGRMSSISGSSVGDSGTHSDNEERKLILSNSIENYDFKPELDLNYTHVPAPKPVKCSIMQYFQTINENKPETRPDVLPLTVNQSKANEQFYIQFPPNGQPIADLNETSDNENTSLLGAKQQYVNITPSVAPSAEVSSHEYINYKIPTPT